MTPGIRGDGAERSIGMPGTGKDRYFRTRNWFMGSSLKRRRGLSALSCGRTSVITAGTDMILTPGLMTDLHHTRIKVLWIILLVQEPC